MRLYHPEKFGESCCVTNISILTGWKFVTVRQKILEQRHRFRFNRNGFRGSKKYPLSTEYAFLPEISAILRKKGIKIRWRKAVGNYQTFANKFNRGIYLVYLTNHISIVKNGQIFDNMGWEKWIGYHNFRLDRVHFYAKLG